MYTKDRGDLMDYTELLIEADNLSLITKEKPLRAHDGRIKRNKIAIRKDMPETQKKCVLAEELGHFHTTVGNILDQSSAENRKQEQRARAWAYNRLIGLNRLISAYNHGCRSAYEVAHYLDVTEEFLKEAVECYKQKYGIYARIDNYIIYFEPQLAVVEMF